MNRKRSLCAAALVAAAVVNASPALAQKGGLPVTGKGTAGRVAKFDGAASVTDSVIAENKFGQIGIGTDQPSSRLTVFGKIESLTGGFKFPDGTTQLSAGLLPTEAVLSLNGLRGDLTLAGSENVIVTPNGNTVVLSTTGLLRTNEAVTSLDGLRGDVTLVAGDNVSLAHSGNSVVISAEATATSVVHDASLSGDGSAGSPLGVSVPLSLVGSTTGALVSITNTERPEGKPIGLSATGGDAVGDEIVGDGVFAHGGEGLDGFGGAGIVSFGGTGHGATFRGGSGIHAFDGLGEDGADRGLAGDFTGDILVAGDVQTFGATTRETDHPLDPTNKVLRHATVESSELLNVYSGNATTDAQGEAVVALPDWFGAVNADLRYQLTVVGTFAQAMVAEEVSDNRFTIRTSEPNVKVSWQITGVRADAASKARTFSAVADKPERERGTYLEPSAFGAPADRGVEYVRYPELMKRR